MNEPRHQVLPINGIRMHFVEQGKGPLVLLCHGWPELWYSWRHQLQALADAGFRAVAPDMRGYGETSAPEPVEAYSMFHLVGDMVGLVEALGEERAIIVGHDWGAAVAWTSALMRPDVFDAVAGLSVPHRQRGPADPMAMLRASGSENYYWMYFQRPGVAESEFERDVRVSLRKVLFGLSGNASDPAAMGMLAPGGGFLDGHVDPEHLPGWLTEKDLATYVSAFERTGFRGGLNWYRNMSLNWALASPWQGAKIRQPSLFIAGSVDPVIAGKRGKAGLQSMRETVLNVQELILDGAGHWIQQERAREVSEALVRFVESVRS